VFYESLVVLLAARGEVLGPDALASLTGVSPTWMRIEREGTSTCLAARVRHAEPPREFRDRVRRWAASRRWAVTVAPCAPSL